MSTPTHDQILTEPAGAQMDAWVAEHIMGYHGVAVYNAGRPHAVAVLGGAFTVHSLKYSQDKTHAMDMLEHLAATGAWEVRIGMWARDAAAGGSETGGSRGPMFQVSVRPLPDSGCRKKTLQGSALAVLACRVALLAWVDARASVHLEARKQ